MTLMSRWVRTSSGDRSRTGPIGSRTPALLIHKSTVPNRSNTVSANWLTAAASVTSTVAATTPSPAGRAGAERLHRPRRSPRRWNSAAIPAPRPRLAPVITTTRPLAIPELIHRGRDSRGPGRQLVECGNNPQGPGQNWHSNILNAVQAGVHLRPPPTSAHICRKMVVDVALQPRTCASSAHRGCLNVMTMLQVRELSC